MLVETIDIMYRPYMYRYTPTVLRYTSTCTYGTAEFSFLWDALQCSWVEVKHEHRAMSCSHQSSLSNYRCSHQNLKRAWTSICNAVHQQSLLQQTMVMVHLPHTCCLAVPTRMDMTINITFREPITQFNVAYCALACVDCKQVTSVCVSVWSRLVTLWGPSAVMQCKQMQWSWRSWVSARCVFKSTFLTCFSFGKINILNRDASRIWECSCQGSLTMSCQLPAAFEMSCSDDQFFFLSLMRLIS